MKGILMLSGLFAVTVSLGQEWKDSKIRVNEGGIEITVPAIVDSYFVLRQGELPTIDDPKDIVLESLGVAILRDEMAFAEGMQKFYQVQVVSLMEPLDLDEDGMDDFYELNRPLILDPLDPLDAAEDPDADGRGNWQEFRAGTDPEVADLSKPKMPILTVVGGSTSEMQWRVEGTARLGETVEISGGLETQTQVIADSGTFSVDVLLRPNRLNRLFVRSMRADETYSAPAVLEVIQDTQSPSLFIDFPAADATLATEAVVVAGRVGDILSGYSGLEVDVNDQPANVIVGIGTNGTFEHGQLPLALGANEITVRAQDALGNMISRSVTVTRVANDVTRLEVVSGNMQIGAPHTRLAEPIVIRALQADGTPLANLSTTFRVTRSDGRLEGASEMVVQTDVEGMAQVSWTLAQTQAAEIIVSKCSRQPLSSEHISVPRRMLWCRLRSVLVPEILSESKPVESRPKNCAPG